MYLSDEGGIQKDEKAIEYLTMAATQGYSKVQLWLETCLLMMKAIKQAP